MPIADPDRLAEMTDAFRDAKPMQMDELPEDGDYQAIVEEFDSFTAKASGDLYVKTIMRITHDQKYDGWKAWTIHNVTDPERIDWFKTHLTALGADVEALNEDFSKLDAVLRDVLDVPVEIRVKTSDTINQKTGEPYKNCYVQQRLGGPITGDLPAEEFPELETPASDDEPEIPF